VDDRPTLGSSNSGYLDFAANLVYEVGRFAHVRLGARMSGGDT
jgi:hypothetical protein